MYVYRNELKSDDGVTLGEFSSHWAATAAMIRINRPEFVSLLGDSADDLAEEAKMKDKINEQA